MPLFFTTPEHAEIIKSINGLLALAEVLADSIRTMFPGGGLIALSVGHKYKDSRPGDRGALVLGSGGTEAEFAESVLSKTQVMLEAGK